MSEVKGTTSLSADVVNQVAAFVAKTIPGVHKLGKTSLIDLLTKDIGSESGVAAEVGQEEIAFDIDLVVKYGHPVHKVAEELRAALIEQGKNMLDRNVVEVNINVVGVHFEEEKKKKEEPKKPESRVR